MPVPLRFNDRVLIVGKTQSGKSTFARYLFGRMTGARRVCVNVKGRVDVGVPPVSDPAAIDWSSPVVNFVPASFDRDVFEELYQRIRVVGGPTVVWLDEAYGVTKSNYAPDALLIVQQQGAELGIGHLVCSQRPYNIAVPLRSEAEHVYMFVPPGTFRDIECLAEEVGEQDGHAFTGRDLRDRLRALGEREGPHSFLWYCRATGELTDCAPIPAPLAAAPFRVTARRRPSSTPPAAGVERTALPESEVS